MESADLVAYVEVVDFSLEKQEADLRLYRVKAKTLESFKGPDLKNFIFYQWIGEDVEDDEPIKVIVALKKSNENGAYIFPKGEGSFPDFEALLDFARSYH